MRRTVLVVSIAAATVLASSAVAAPSSASSGAPAAPSAHADPSRSDAAALRASTAAGSLVASRPRTLYPSASDSYTQLKVISGGNGLQYVPYERRYNGIPVVGGDFVVVTDAQGRVLNTSVGQQSPIDVRTGATISALRAGDIATSAAQAKKVGNRAVTSTRLVVLATLAKPRLAYESVVTGNRGAIPSRLHVFIDAGSGALLRTYDDVSEGSGTGAINGPNPLAITTSGSGSSFSMTDPARPGISCRNYATGAVLTGTDDLWGNGNGTAVETGCVDALFDVQRQWTMLSSWLGRNGINGAGGGFPVHVGLNDLNAFWDGSRVVIGRNTVNGWISSLDVVGHEYGHAIDSNTPGGQSGNGVSEATGDIFGALTEAFANQPAAYDPPDYAVGEEINLVGSGPIRYMYNPSLAGDPNCYSPAIPTTETHAAAGPFNHFFYLAAQGSSPTNGNPASPTCNGSSVTGALGNLTMGRIFYNAMLSKTSGMTYLRYRTATLNAAKNLFPGNCAPFATVKAAWDAVSVPAQAGDPVCSTSTTPVVANPGNRTSTRNVATSLQMTATGGTPPYTWSATGLPAGLSINASTGLISGTPTVLGTSTVVVTATGGGSGSTTFSWTISATSGCSSPGQKLANPGFESGSTSWTATAGVIGQYGGQGQPTHGGTWNAWLNGYGRAHTDSLAQSVALPAGCTITLSFFLHIDTAETTTTTQYDKLTVKAGSTVVATYSNLNKAAGYTLRTLNLTAFAGQTVSLSFTGVEDSSLQTSFVVDDTAVSAS